MLTASLALVKAATVEEVAGCAVRHAARLTGARAATLAGLRIGDAEARVLATHGDTGAFAHAPPRFPLTAPTPLAEALRSGQPLWFDSPDDLARRYHGSPVRDAFRPPGPSGFLPLRARARVIGVLALGGGATPFDDRARADALVLADAAGAALDRARRYEGAQERAAATAAASELRSQLLVAVAHDLRTPLSAIMGFAGLLAEEVGGPLTEKQRVWVGSVRSSAEHMVLLAEDLLAATRLDAGQVAIRNEWTVPHDVVRDAAALFEPEFRAKGLTLRLDLARREQPVRIDVTKFRQILLNLVSNAVKFTEIGSVELSLVQTDTQLIIQVRDTGGGIAPADIDRIFEPFWRADSSVGTAGGAGLGLDVSRRLARVLGGDLRVHSTVGQGTTFTLLLPATPHGAREAPLTRRANDQRSLTQ